MSLAINKPQLSPDDLLALPDAIGYELVDGNLKERNMGSMSSYVGGTVYYMLRCHAATHQLGWVFPSDNGFVCFPNSPKTLRRPDVSFVGINRLKAEDVPEGWLKIIPDLVVEVVSPNDLSYELELKIAEYSNVGIPLIWVVFPPTRTVRVVRADGSTSLLRSGDELSGEDVVPGFRCAVADLFFPMNCQPIAENPA